MEHCLYKFRLSALLLCCIDTQQPFNVTVFGKINVFFTRGSDLFRASVVLFVRVFNILRAFLRMSHLIFYIAVAFLRFFTIFERAHDDTMTLLSRLLLLSSLLAHCNDIGFTNTT